MHGPGRRDDCLLEAVPLEVNQPASIVSFSRDLTPPGVLSSNHEELTSTTTTPKATRLLQSSIASSPLAAAAQLPRSSDDYWYAPRMQPSILPSSRISSGDDDYSGPKLVILGATGYVGGKRALLPVEIGSDGGDSEAHCSGGESTAAFVETLAQIDHGYNVVAIHRSTLYVVRLRSCSTSSLLS